ncbi:MAG: radical SAM protein [Calditrichaeota bacterium]|nr:radical SAM protein [Calditrichota bacterium]
MKHLFGPVPSRRLGVSLGIDPIPKKVCSLDCVYCEVDKTSMKTLERAEYISARDILSELQEYLSHNHVPLDFITFSGSGEPTLNSQLGYLIREIKRMTDTPIAVITNGTLLWRPDVREDLLPADLVMPSLDAGSEEIFRKVNHPVKGLTLKRVLEGLVQFRKDYSGPIWLEILIVKNVNDKEEEYYRLAEAVRKINPDRVQLNTVVRPPGFGRAQPVTKEELQKLRQIIGPKAEIIATFDRETNKAYREKIEESLITLLKIRACTIEEMEESLGIHRDELLKYLELLQEDRRLQRIQFEGKTYFKIPSEAELVD